MTDARSVGARQRWSALAVVCLGTLMIVLDTTIVNVALPSIREDLGFSETSLVWVVNAYLLTFGGCLLLGGRLGDLHGHRRLFVAGLVLFTAASAVCGFAQTQGLLIAARAVQGLGGAVVDAIALSLIVNLFEEADGRAKAMGVYGFVCAAGGSLGVLLGGLLTQALGWHWVFLVNVPIGVIVCVLCFTLLPAIPATQHDGRLDVAGAATVTAALGLALFARAPVGGDFWIDVLPGMTLLGFGAGLALNPLILAAMSEVEPAESGIASGIVNTAFMMGGALGLAVLASLAAARTGVAAAGGAGEAAALNAGYHVAFAVGAAAAAIAAVLSWTFIRGGGPTATTTG